MFFDKLKSGYQKIKEAFVKKGSLLGEKIRGLFSKGIDEETIDQLEQILYEADIGVNATIELTNKIKEMHRKNPNVTVEDLITTSKEHLFKLISQQNSLVLYITNGLNTKTSRMPSTLVIPQMNISIRRSQIFVTKIQSR